MRRYLGLIILLAGLLVVGSLGASTSTGATTDTETLDVVLPWTPSFFLGAATDACSTSLINDVGLRQAGSCVPYGNLCDPRYVPGAVCCPGLDCTYLYPGVPRYCL